MRVESDPSALVSTRPLLLTQPTPQPRVPWWDDLAPAVRAELELPTEVELDAQVFDVVVIGAGLAGLSAALSARRAGARVLLLERNTMIGYGASGRNSGILSAGVNVSLSQFPPDSPEAALWPATTRLLLSLIEEAARPDTLLDAHLTGALSLAETISAARLLAREAHARERLGLRAEIWTAARVSEVTQGHLDLHSLILALWLPDEGRVHPLTLLAHLARQARAAGVEFAGLAHVATCQEQRRGSAVPRWQLVLADGRCVQARGLISAVGPGASPNARIYAQSFAVDLPADFPLFWDASPYTYADFRPEPGRVIISGGRYGRAGLVRHDARYHARLSELARHWLPALRGREPACTWAFDLEVTAETIPTLRPLGERAPGVSIEGLGALGVLPGLLLGEEAGREIAHHIGKSGTDG